LRARYRGRRGPPESYRVGVEYEILLAHRLLRMGFFVVRSPASGRGCKRLFYPDLVAIKSGIIYLVEVRYRGDDRHILLDAKKYAKYMHATRITGGKPVLCVFYAGIGDFRCLDMREYDNRTNLHYIYYREKIYTRGKPPEEFFETQILKTKA